VRSLRSAAALKMTKFCVYRNRGSTNTADVWRACSPAAKQEANAETYPELRQIAKLHTVLFSLSDRLKLKTNIVSGAEKNT
jgi:hypothetical protein